MPKNKESKENNKENVTLSDVRSEMTSIRNELIDNDFENQPKNPKVRALNKDFFQKSLSLSSFPVDINERSNEALDMLKTAIQSSIQENHNITIDTNNLLAPTEAMTKCNRNDSFDRIIEESIKEDASVSQESIPQLQKKLEHAFETELIVQSAVSSLLKDKKLDISPKSYNDLSLTIRKSMENMDPEYMKTHQENIKTDITDAIKESTKGKKVNIEQLSKNINGVVEKHNSAPFEGFAAKSGKKEGGAHKSDVEGGIYKSKDGKDKSLIKRDVKDLRNDIAEYMAAELFEKVSPNSACNITLQKSKDTGRTFLASKFFKDDYQDIFKDLGKERGKAGRFKESMSYWLKRATGITTYQYLHDGLTKKDKEGNYLYQNYEKATVTSLLLGDKSIHSGNIGVVNRDGKLEVVRIDFGAAFRKLGKNINPLKSEVNSQNFEKNYFLRDHPEERTYTKEFSEELKRQSKIDLNPQIEKTWNEVIKNYDNDKESYAITDFGKQIGVSKELLKTEPESVRFDLIKKHFADTMKERQQSLKDMASEIDLNLCVNKDKSIDIPKFMKVMAENPEHVTAIVNDPSKTQLKLKLSKKQLDLVKPAVELFNKKQSEKNLNNENIKLSPEKETSADKKKETIKKQEIADKGMDKYKGLSMVEGFLKYAEDNPDVKFSKKEQELIKQFKGDETPILLEQLIEGRENLNSTELPKKTMLRQEPDDSNILMSGGKKEIDVNFKDTTEKEVEVVVYKESEKEIENPLQEKARQDRAALNKSILEFAEANPDLKFSDKELELIEKLKSEQKSQSQNEQDKDKKEEIEIKPEAKKENLAKDTITFSPKIEETSLQLNKSDAVDPITQSIRDEVIVKQNNLLQEEIAKTMEGEEKQKFVEGGHKALKSYLETPEGSTSLDQAMAKPEIRKQMNDLEKEGYKTVHTKFAKSFRDVDWGKSGENEVRSTEVTDSKGNPVCTLNETTINNKPPLQVQHSDGTIQTINSCRKIDFPKELETGNGPMHVSMAVQDANGKNIAEKDAVYFTAHYDKNGKLTEMSSPTPVYFAKDPKSSDGVCYIMVDDKPYTLPVTQDKYLEMMKEVSKNNSLETSKEQEVTQSKDKIYVPEKDTKELQKETKTTDKELERESDVKSPDKPMESNEAYPLELYQNVTQERRDLLGMGRKKVNKADAYILINDSQDDIDATEKDTKELRKETKTKDKELASKPIVKNNEPDSKNKDTEKKVVDTKEKSSTEPIVKNNELEFQTKAREMKEKREGKNEDKQEVKGTEGVNSGTSTLQNELKALLGKKVPPEVQDLANKTKEKIDKSPIDNTSRNSIKPMSTPPVETKKQNPGQNR
jgi:hypothetical protein